MWNETDSTVVVAQFLGVVGVISGVVAYIKKNYPKEAKAVENVVVDHVGDVAIHVAHGLGRIFSNLIKMPFFAGLAVQGELQVHHIENHLLDTHLALAAVRVVGAFNAGLKVEVDTLSPTQKSDIIQFVRSELKKVGVEKTDPEIVQALKSAQAELTNIVKTVVPVIQQHDAAVQAWSVTSQSI